MNFQFYLEKLLESTEFKKFKTENSDAFLCSGFFSIDKQGKDNQQHLDFYSPDKKKIFSFQMEKDFSLNSLDSYDEKIPSKLDKNLDFSFDELEKIIIDKMNKEKVNKQIQKLLFSLQKLDNVDFVIGTIFISGMGILKVTFDLSGKKIISFEKKSFFDLLKIVKR